MKLICFRFCLLLCTMLLTPTGVVALELTDWLRINGFGTAGTSVGDSNQFRYSTHPEGTKSGKSQFNFRTNTVVGLQGTLRFTDNWTATAQGVMLDHEEEDWRTNLEWAYLQYHAPWDFNIRAGQFRLPIFRTSELAYVGYARTFARPPVQFYGVGGYDHFWGAQLFYQLNYDAYDVVLRASYGYSEDETPQRVLGSYESFHSDDIKIVSAQFGSHNFWINTAYAHMTSDITRHRNGTENPQGKTRIATYSIEGKASIDDFGIEGGYAFSDNELQPDERIYYYSANYRYKMFKPYILYSYKRFSNLPSPGPNLPGSDETTHRSITTSLGCRYDIYPGIALKYQFDRFDIGYNVGETRRRDTASYRVHTLVADWMF